MVSATWLELFSYGFFGNKEEGKLEKGKRKRKERKGQEMLQTCRLGSLQGQCVSV